MQAMHSIYINLSYHIMLELLMKDEQIVPWATMLRCIHCTSGASGHSAWIENMTSNPYTNQAGGMDVLAVIKVE